MQNDTALLRRRIAIFFRAHAELAPKLSDMQRLEDAAQRSPEAFFAKLVQRFGSEPPFTPYSDKERQHCISLLNALYQKVDPSRLENVPTLAAKYQDMEEALFAALNLKYKLEGDQKVTFVPLKLSALSSVPKESSNGGSIPSASNESNVAEVSTSRTPSGEASALPQSVTSTTAAGPPLPKSSNQLTPNAPSQVYVSAPTVVSTSSSSLPTDNSFQSRLVRFYAHYDPTKIENIPSVISKYKGMEQRVLDTLVAKYGPEPAIVEDNETKKMELRERLLRFYGRYDPSKLSNVDDIVDRYLGAEKDLFEVLVKKYGPEPEKGTVEAPRPSEVVPAQPAPAQPAQPAPAQPAQPAPPQAAQPAPAQPAQSAPAQPAQTAPAQPAQPAPAQPAQPAPAQPAQSAPAQPAQPAPAQPAPAQLAQGQPAPAPSLADSANAETTSVCSSSSSSSSRSGSSPPPPPADFRSLCLDLFYELQFPPDVTHVLLHCFLEHRRGGKSSIDDETAPVVVDTTSTNSHDDLQHLQDTLRRHQLLQSAVSSSTSPSRYRKDQSDSTVEEEEKKEGESTTEVVVVGDAIWRDTVSFATVAKYIAQWFPHTCRLTRTNNSVTKGAEVLWQYCPHESLLLGLLESLRSGGGGGAPQRCAASAEVVSELLCAGEATLRTLFSLLKAADAFCFECNQSVGERVGSNAVQLALPWGSAESVAFFMDLHDMRFTETILLQSLQQRWIPRLVDETQSVFPSTTRAQQNYSVHDSEDSFAHTPSTMALLALVMQSHSTFSAEHSFALFLRVTQLIERILGHSIATAASSPHSQKTTQSAAPSVLSHFLVNERIDVKDLLSAFRGQEGLLLRRLVFPTSLVAHRSRVSIPMAAVDEDDNDSVFAPLCEQLDATLTTWFGHDSEKVGGGLSAQELMAIFLSDAVGVVKCFAAVTGQDVLRSFVAKYPGRRRPIATTLDATTPQQHSTVGVEGGGSTSNSRLSESADEAISTATSQQGLGVAQRVEPQQVGSRDQSTVVRTDFGQDPTTACRLDDLFREEWSLRTAIDWAEYQESSTVRSRWRSVLDEVLLMEWVAKPAPLYGMMSGLAAGS